MQLTTVILCIIADRYERIFPAVTNVRFVTSPNVNKNLRRRQRSIKYSTRASNQNLAELHQLNLASGALG